MAPFDLYSVEMFFKKEKKELKLFGTNILSESDRPILLSGSHHKAHSSVLHQNRLAGLFLPLARFVPILIKLLCGASL
jgi:hypothetical protein